MSVPPPIWASGTIAGNNSNGASTTTDAQVTKPVYQDTLSTGANYLDRRHALVGANCMVNRLNTTVSVAGGTAHLENLVNKNLDDGVTFISGVNAQLVTEPSFTIRDVKHVYAKGTTAGFVVTLDNSVLKLSAVDVPMKIFFYKDGNHVGTVSCEQKQGSLLKLKLASYGTNTLEFTAKAPADFDEIGLGSAQLLKADVVGAMTVKYAFVGKNGKYFIDSEQTNGIEDFKAAVKKAYPETTFENGQLVLGQCIGDAQKTPDATGNAIDGNPNNSVDIITKVLLSVWTPLTVSAYGGPKADNLPFKKGMTVGFETAGAGILDVGGSIKLHPYIVTPSNKTGLFSSPWNWQEAPKGGNDGEFTLLGLDLGGGRKDIITTLTEDCNAVEVKAVSLLGLGATVAYRMFVILPPSIDPDDTLRVSAAQAICEDTKSVTLKSNRAVTWQCTSDNGKDLTLTEAADHRSCTVTGFTKAGTYTFVATDDTTKTTRTTTITYGVQRLYNTTAMPWVNNFTDPDVIYTVMTKDDLRKKGINGFDLIDLSGSKNSGNLVNGSIDDYMSFTGGLQLAGSKVVAAIQRSTPIHLKNNTIVGFVLRFQNKILNVDLLNSMKVYAYNSGGKPLTEIKRDHNFKVLQASVAGASNETTTEFNIELRGGQDVDELLLCNNSTLSLDLGDVRIYYAYSEDADDAQSFADEQTNTGEIVSYNDGARIDEKMLSGFKGVASVASLKENFTNFIDGNMTDFLSVTNSVEAAGEYNIIPVKLGKLYSNKHMIEIKVGDIPGIAQVDVANLFKLEAYRNGVQVDYKKEWNTVDATVIGTGGDYTIRWTPKEDFDEIVIREGGLAKLLNIDEKFYGMRIYSDADGDGIPDYEDDESCPNVAFLIDENEPSLYKTHDFTTSKMYLHRTFKQGKWSTICLPVDMTYNQFANTFGSDARLATPADCKDETPNTIQFYIQETHGNQVLLHKNTPYIIKVINMGDAEKADSLAKNIDADDGTTVKLYDEQQSNLAHYKETSSSATDGQKYIIYGVNYNTNENSEATIPQVTCKHLSSDFWPMTTITWHGTFVSPQTIDEPFYTFRLEPKDNKDAEFDYDPYKVTGFRGLRCWMTTNENATPQAKQLSLAVGNEVISNGTATGINEMKNTMLGNGNIYTLTGILVRRAATSTEGLSKGIYIWNNKKIEIK